MDVLLVAHASCLVTQPSRAKLQRMNLPHVPVPDFEEWRERMRAEPSDRVCPILAEVKWRIALDIRWNAIVMITLEVLNERGISC